MILIIWYQSSDEEKTLETDELICGTCAHYILQVSGALKSIECAHNNKISFATSKVFPRLSKECITNSYLSLS